MNGDVCLPDKSQIAREILAYLTKHPDAQETLDGIVQGWLLDRGNKYKQTMVHEVVKDLVLEGTILENKIPGSHAVYRLNLAKRDRMRELMKKKGKKDQPLR
ncbi:MAG TPA: hypothetical protein VL122_08270 [Nitrospirota bacterium]|nr:hypothetical protein [Nitrospirota bacterium]